MADDRPDRILVVPDDLHARHVGVTADGRQFFLTYPFVESDGAVPGCDYVALYVFDSAGTLIRHAIEALGPPGATAPQVAQIEEKLLATVRPTTASSITVRPFAVAAHGASFGLVARRVLGEWRVSAEPGDYLAFHAPWDSGAYDT